MRPIERVPLELPAKCRDINQSRDFLYDAAMRTALRVIIAP